MKQYLDLLQHILDNGEEVEDRTGTGTLSVFGYQMRFDLSKGFPLLTTKKLHTKSIFHELLWFISGDTNIKYLNDNDVHIWDDWQGWTGDLGPIYGHQWRNFGKTCHSIGEADHEGDPVGPQGYIQMPGFDQLEYVVNRIQDNPDCRRLIVSSWNPNDVEDAALPPCHCLFQFKVYNGKLSCQLYQRSCDTFIGVPFNIASYALLTHMVAAHCNLQVGEFIWVGGDVHLYLNHIEQAKEQLSRDLRALPVLQLHGRNGSDGSMASLVDPNCRFDLFTCKYEQIEITSYDPHPHIKAEVSV